MSVILENVSKIFDDPSRKDGHIKALDQVSLEIKEGELVTFLGPSGCGKTTTLRIVSGFENPTEGKVFISGKLVNDIPPNKRDTSMVFQSYAIFPHMSVEQNIGFGLELKGNAKKEVKDESRRIMEVMGLLPLAKRRPDQLSGGQQQRVALARAIINKPSVLLFDEPLSNLDAKLRDQMRLEIRRIQQAFGITSIYVTHDQIEAMTVSDRIVVMNNGRVIQIGTPFEIYSRPAKRFVADFIGRVNFIPCETVSIRGEEAAASFKGVEIGASSHTGDLTDGSPCILAVRPESLVLELAEKKAKSIIGGKIEKAVYLGSVVEYEIDAGLDSPILAVSHDPVVNGFFKQGDMVAINFPKTAAHAMASE
ncbi:ABC transporter ATP-binding protein [Spirochaetota bacterium]